MADNGVTKETPRQTTPLDVMVATFADRQAAKDAYQTLKTMDKEGTINMDGAVVIDRNEMGKIRVESATLPGWLWAIAAGIGTIMLGMIGALVWLGVMAARGMRMHSQEGGYTVSEADRRVRERDREAMRLATE